MPLDKLALICIIVVAVLWCSVLLAGVVATLPYGLPALVVIAIVGYFLYRVVRDRLANTEDDYYEKNIKQ
jgi:hypothetical protein